MVYASQTQICQLTFFIKKVIFILGNLSKIQGKSSPATEAESREATAGARRGETNARLRRSETSTL
jgi:hypothetical protein